VPKEFAEQKPKALGGRFPFLCQLRGVASGGRWLEGNGQWTGRQLENMLSAWTDSTSPGGLTPAVFRDELANGRLVVILDGVDEIPGETDVAQLSAINFAPRMLPYSKRERLRSDYI
jgi:hypothetical protein